MKARRDSFTRTEQILAWLP